MESLSLGGPYSAPFTLDAEPDELPTAVAYAGSTSLGAITVATGPASLAYQVSGTLPGSSIADGTEIKALVTWVVGGETRVNWVRFGYVNLHAVQAAAVLAAAAESPIHVDVRKVLGGQPVVNTNVAELSKQIELLEGQVALLAAIAGIDVGTGGGTRKLEVS